jgi:hypothetical protein
MVMRTTQSLTSRLALPLITLAACLWSEAALADPPWRRGHHEPGWGNRGHGQWYSHGRHREHRGWHGRPVIVVPPPVYRPPPVVVIPGYAVPYRYGHHHGWGYAPYGGEAEMRLRVPIR